MSVILEQTPEISPGPYSDRRWVSAHNPVEFKFQRADYNIINLVYIGLNTLLEVTTVSNINDVSVGDTVYIGASGFLTGVHIVDTVHPGGALNKIYVKQEVPYPSGTTPKGFMNVPRVGWLLDVWLRDPNTGATIGRGNFYDNSEGEIFADVREYLLPSLEFDVNYDFFGINRRINSGKRDFFIQYTENYDGFTGTPQDTFEFYAVKSAQQLKSFYGSNMFAYHTNGAVDPIPADQFLMKFMSASKVPTLFLQEDENGQFQQYPHGLGFIYSQYNDQFLKVRKVQQLGINKTSIAPVQSDNLNASDAINMQALNLRAVTFLGDCYYVNLWLEEAEAVPESYSGDDPVGSGPEGLPSDYVDPDYVE